MTEKTNKHLCSVCKEKPPEEHHGYSAAYRCVGCSQTKYTCCGCYNVNTMGMARPPHRLICEECTASLRSSTSA